MDMLGTPDLLFASAFDNGLVDRNITFTLNRWAHLMGWLQEIDDVVKKIGHKIAEVVQNRPSYLTTCF